MLPISITDKKYIAKDTWEFTFQRLEAGALNIEAGQYMRIVIPEIAGGARENSRIFSAILMFRSSISKHEEFAAVFRASASAFKQYLINAPIGAEMLAHGPFGDFTLPKDVSCPIVFVAGGVGIAPFLSMARLAAAEKLPHRITLLYANKDEESAAYLPELAGLERENPNFSMRLKFGETDKEFLSAVSRQPSNVIYYIAGPIGMVNEVKKILEETGVEPVRIRCEIFG